MSLLLAAALAASASCDVPTRSSADDFRASLAALGIAGTRPGPSGDLSNPNHANNDEAQARWTSPLPPVLRAADGRPVTRATWPARRRELLAQFEAEVVGRVPANAPAVRWTVEREGDVTLNGVAAHEKILVGTIASPLCPTRMLAFPVRLVTPRAARRVPVVVTFRFDFPAARPAFDDMTAQLVAAGIAQASFAPADVQPDTGAGLTAGVIGLANGGALRRPDEWGALRAWAWAASRVLDRLGQEPAVDARRAAIEGLSRYGKAALVTMAFEPRFAGGFAGSSGEGGASPYRRSFGEAVENLASESQHHWFAPAFLRYGGPRTADDLPVDANSLIALSAPRPLLLGNGNLQADWWTDPHGAFLAAAAASPVWPLLGAPGLSSTDYPEAEVPSGTTGLTWRRHNGGHTNLPNWPFVIAWSKASWAR
jgi:hypothetical protein